MRYYPKRSDVTNYSIKTRCSECRSYMDRLLKDQNDKLKTENTELKECIKYLVSKCDTSVVEQNDKLRDTLNKYVYGDDKT